MGWQGSTLGEVERITMKIAIVDTYYPEALKAMPIGSGSYQEELEKVLALQFGTADFYSKNLRTLGWEAIDIIANHAALQQRWADENGGTFGSIVERQIETFDPDVVFFQDLSLTRRVNFELGRRIVAGQCSCPMPPRPDIAMLDVCFTSFPHYVDLFSSIGPKTHYVPLAFEPSVLTGNHEREIDCVFIGGVGVPSHWSYGMKVLEAIATEIPNSSFYGYGYDLLPMSSPIKKKYKGPAWGKEMYAILQRSKICINRHGEVAGEYANNMRLYEATGCGALLATERKTNIRDLFSSDEIVEYDNPTDAVIKIEHYLKHWNIGQQIAHNGQKRTLWEHTYAKRMETVSNILKAELN